MSEYAAAEERPAGQTGGSGCGGGRGTAPSLLAIPPGQVWTPRRKANARATLIHRVSIPPQGSVDNARPPMSRLTARTLQKAHTQVRHLHRLGRAIPQGLAVLERDYNAWRRRVQRGRQRETLLAAGEEARHQANVVAMQCALDQVWADLEAEGWRWP